MKCRFQYECVVISVSDLKVEDGTYISIAWERGTKEEKQGVTERLKVTAGCATVEKRFTFETNIVAQQGGKMFLRKLLHLSINTHVGGESKFYGGLDVNLAAAARYGVMTEFDFDVGGRGTIKFAIQATPTGDIHPAIAELLAQPTQPTDIAMPVVRRRD
eukprot:Rmarinus@m.9964